MIRPLWRLLPLALVPLALVACGGDDEEELKSATTLPPDAEQVVVDEAADLIRQRDLSPVVAYCVARAVMLDPTVLGWPSAVAVSHIAPEAYETKLAGCD